MAGVLDLDLDQVIGPIQTLKVHDFNEDITIITIIISSHSSHY